MKVKISLKMIEKAILTLQIQSLCSKAYTEEEQEKSYFDGETRVSKVTDKELLDELNNGKTIKVYRAMQMVDGKLYPPMSGVLKGKMQEPIEADSWYQSDERQDLVEWRDNTWKFPLQKNKKDGKMWVAYNPYWHTSHFPLNDQFSSAWNRPELVTIEVEVPESEIKSGNLRCCPQVHPRSDSLQGCSGTRRKGKQSVNMGANLFIILRKWTIYSQKFGNNAK